MKLSGTRTPGAVALALVLAAAPAFAAPRQQGQAEALASRMQAAEARFSRASVGIRNADPAAQRESDAALEDMEDVINACIRVRGCPVNSLLATYKRLLKQGIDADLADDNAADDDSIAPEALGHERGALAVPAGAHAASLLGDAHRFDHMVEFNPAVQQAIRRWLTDLRGPFLSSYENYLGMRSLMWPEFQRQQLPEALLFGIVAKESNGKVHATSRAGASGPMQFMPATGRRFGLGPDGTGFDTRYDPRSAAMASAEYLNQRMGELNNSIELSLAAYNGGEGRALRVFQSSGGRSFWDASVYNQFPAETRDYVPMVIAAGWLFLHAKEYGLTLPKVDPNAAPLRLTQPTSIYQLTMCLGNRGTRDGYMRALRNLNPRYEPDAYLSAGTTLNANGRIVGLYSRYCTSGHRAELARTLALSDASRAIVRTGPLMQLPDGTSDSASGGVDSLGRPALGLSTSAAGLPPSVQPVRDYPAQDGETATTIARKFECALPEFMQANGIGATDALPRGRVIQLVGCRN